MFFSHEKVVLHNLIKTFDFTLPYMLNVKFKYIRLPVENQIQAVTSS